VLLYPFGFVALFVQFTKYFGLDFYTAWYAASLVNRVVAIGQGVTILILALFGSVLLSAKIGQLFLRHENRTGPGRFVSRGVLRIKLLGLFVGTLFMYILYSRILAGGRFGWLIIRGRESTECVARAQRHQIDLWPDSLVPALIFFVGSLFGGWLIYRSYVNHRRTNYAPERRYHVADYRLRPNFFNRGVTEGWILSGLMTAYAASVVASVFLAAFTPAFVPYMTYGDSVEYRGVDEPTHNRFLSHADAHWYILHRLEKNGIQPEYRIVSLAAADVEHVRVRPNPPRASRVAPLLRVRSTESDRVPTLKRELCEKVARPRLPQNPPEIPEYR
jgi:hypothetical protein